MGWDEIYVKMITLVLGFITHTRLACCYFACSAHIHNTLGIVLYQDVFVFFVSVLLLILKTRH